MKIIVLFNLKAGAAPSAYEDWARANDIPTVNKLASVNGFEVLRSTGLLGTDTPAPYQYIELLDVKSLDALVADAGSDAMQKIAAEFQTFADSPQFILTENVVG